ncbi:MAG: hypothetical protein WHX52_10875 [Anaerolineae bacterium]
MRKFTITVLVITLLFVATFTAIGVVLGQTPLGPIVLSRETQSESTREIIADEIVAPEAISTPQQPTIGFIDSPSATCYIPDPGQDSCYINWYYLSVGASPNYMITMTATIDTIGPVAHVQGFFQTSMYIPYNMLGQGIRVPCGSPGAGGNPQLGNAYAFTIRARDSAGLSSTNYGTVYCPPFTP